MHTHLRQRIETGFEWLGHFLYRRHWVALIVVGAVVASLGLQIPKLTIDTSTEGFLHEDDPTLLAYNAFRSQFGRDEMVLVAVESKGGVFEPGFLRRLAALHRELEEQVPYIDDITSLVNARSTRGVEGALIVEDLLEAWPENAEMLAAVRERALANPVYRNLLLSEDGRVTAVVIKTDAYSSEGLSTDDALAGFDSSPVLGRQAERKFLTDAENSALVQRVNEIAARFEAPDFRLHVGGSPAISDAIKRAMQTNMKRFMGLALLTIALILALLFRRVSGVVLPLVVVVLTLLSTLGAMAVAGIPFKLPTQILPSFLLAVGVGASVHVLAVFFRNLHGQQQAGQPAPAAKEAAIGDALGHSGLAIMMTSLTTAAGLASFAGAEIAPIADLGLVAAIGVLISLLYTIVLLPALLALLPIKPKADRGTRERHARMDALLIRIADSATGRRRAILFISALVLLFGIAGTLQVRFSHKPFEWLPASHAARQAIDFIDSRMGGASAVEVVVDTGEENGLYDPGRLKALHALQQEVGRIERPELFVGKTLAVTDILKETNKALNENREAFYRVPDDRNLIAQEFLLFANSGSDDLEDFVDSGFTKARFTAKMPWVDSIYYRDFIADLERRFQAGLPGIDITVTGMAALLGRTAHAAMYSMAESYVWAALVITVMMLLLIGDWRIGLVAMLPNLAPILLTLGLMGWLGIRLDLFTMLIGSIAIGLAVDDTIHFMHNYRRYHQQSGDVADAVRRTLLTTGRAMLVTTLVLSIGFFIFAFSTLNNLINFGLLTGFTIVTALLADFFLAPALMAQLHASHLIPDEGDY